MLRCARARTRAPNPARPKHAAPRAPPAHAVAVGPTRHAACLLQRGATDATQRFNVGRAPVPTRARAPTAAVSVGGALGKCRPCKAGEEPSSDRSTCQPCQPNSYSEAGWAKCEAKKDYPEDNCNATGAFWGGNDDRNSEYSNYCDTCDAAKGFALVNGSHPKCSIAPAASAPGALIPHMHMRTHSHSSLCPLPPHLPHRCCRRALGRVVSFCSPCLRARARALRRC